MKSRAAHFNWKNWCSTAEKSW